MLKYAELLKNYEISLNGNRCKLCKDHDKYGWYYFSNNTNNDNLNGKYQAEIGDIRVRFWMITQPLSLTVVGRQNGKNINLNKVDKMKESNVDIVCMSRIGKYKVDNALRKLFHVKYINNETDQYL